jgi:hypothetical protein
MKSHIFRSTSSVNSTLNLATRCADRELEGEPSRRVGAWDELGEVGGMRQSSLLSSCCSSTSRFLPALFLAALGEFRGDNFVGVSCFLGLLLELSKDSSTGESSTRESLSCCMVGCFLAFLAFEVSPREDVLPLAPLAAPLPEQLFGASFGALLT